MGATEPQATWTPFSVDAAPATPAPRLRTGGQSVILARGKERCFEFTREPEARPSPLLPSS